MPSPSAPPPPVVAAAAVLLLVALPADTVRVPADTTEASTPEPIRVRPVVPLGALFSGTFSVGLGAGAAVENVGWAGLEIEATAFGALYGHGAALTVSSGDPYRQPVYGLLRAEATRATRRRFFGAGPFTDEDELVPLDHRSATVDARLGAYPLGSTALLVQPSARLLVDRVAPFEPDTEAALRQLDDASQAAALALQDETRMGVSLGLELATDRLDVHDYPSRGTYASVEGRRFVALDGSDLRYSRFASSVSGYLPLADRVVLMGHATGVVTRPDASAVLPFVYLPTLDTDLLLAYAADRFRGRDALALGLGVRMPVVNLYGLYGLDADLTGTLGNVYTDVFEQFDPSVSFDATLPEGRAAPLRPGASLGLRVVKPSASSMVIGGRIGVSPEGLSLALISISADVRDVVPLFR